MLSVGPNGVIRLAVIVWFRKCAVIDESVIVPVIVLWSFVCNVNVPLFPAPPPA